MIEIDIPGRGSYQFRHAVIDVNGTIACDGILMPGVANRLQTLRQLVDVHLLTADTHGGQDTIDHELGMTAHRLPSATGQTEQKAAYVRSLGSHEVVAIGNGANDSLMVDEAALGIAVIGPEGAATATLQQADVVVADILMALDLLLRPKRLVATLRT